MVRAGLVAIDTDDRWIGGRYYLHHLVRCVAGAPPPAQVQLRDVVWGEIPAKDPFREVRAFLDETILVRPAAGLLARLRRKLVNLASGVHDARDLFRAKGIDVCFPIPPCANSGIPYVFWLPDFQYLRRPDLLTPSLRDSMEAYFREHVKAASQIVLSSEDARRDFARVFPDRVGATHVVRFCSVPDAQWWEQDPAGVARRHGLPERFLIVCNQFTRHKNHLVLVEAMKLLRDRGTCDVHLACTGSTFDHRQEDYVGQVRAFVERHGLHDRVHILGLLPRAEQVALMRRSVAVAQPSSFEGWSTIIEDAKTLGKRVFASELPVHAEQLGVAHELLPLDDPAAWAESIERAWPDLTPGPHTQDEADAMSSLAQAQDQCAQAFIRALLAGAHG